MIHNQPVAALHNVEAEGEVIGSMLIDKSIVELAADKLVPDDFYHPINRQLFELMVREASLGKPVSPITLKPYLDSIEGMEESGGASYLFGLTKNCGAHTTFGPCCAQLKELSRRRRIFDGLQNASMMAADMDVELADIVAAADASVADPQQDGQQQLSVLQCFDNMLDDHAHGDIGVTCNVVPELDQVIGSLRNKELIILAARPGMGKTAVALTYALGVAAAGKGVLFISLEMGGKELAARMAADISYHRGKGIPYASIRDGQVKDRNALAAARSKLAKLPMDVLDVGKLTTGRLAMSVMRTKRRMEAKGITFGLVVVDYLQLLTPDVTTRSQYEKISEISMALKAIAKTHDVPVMALAQLSREVEKRTDKVPQLSDLRDSGQIEQDADGVLFLLRDEYYQDQIEPDKDSSDWHEWDAKTAPCRNVIEFICAKRRNGRTGKAKGKFYGQYQAVRGEHG
ncbi:MAG: DnaB-like helicase C-terminal domain-containing protein [Pseudomonadota bacterium]